MANVDLLLEIDRTLDQLIQNAEAIQGVDVKDLSEFEVDAFQKTQESLLHHLLHLDERANHKALSAEAAPPQLEKKFSRFKELKSSYHRSLLRAKRKISVLSKRRSKRFFSENL